MLSAPNISLGVLPCSSSTAEPLMNVPVSVARNFAAIGMPAGASFCIYLLFSTIIFKSEI
jgi:hypothetical protein